MASRDSQTVILSRQTILLVTAVGVGLLTLCYVLGVQVGKQSAALRRPAARGAGEDLLELPAPIGDQLKALESAGRPDFGRPDPGGTGAASPAPPPPAAPAAGSAPSAAPEPAPAPAPSPQAAAPEPPARKAAPAPEKPAKKEPSAEKAEAPGRWTLQLISTPDQAEAQRMMAKATAAGYPAAVVAEKGLYKVRLNHPGSRETMDAAATRLKNRGFKPFAIKVE
jgi:cell division septation protein DedD